MNPKRVRNILLVVLLLSVTMPAFYCNTADKEGVSQWKNVYDTSAHYVGMQTCRTCHEPIYQTFIKTGMGQSFDHATKQKSSADFSPQQALVYDSALDFYYKPYWQNDSLYIMEFRLEGKDTVHKKVQRIDYIVGSGQHTNSHIFSINGYLYQAPITFYTQKHKWDLAPGFEKGANSRFSRMIQAECMTCHNGYPEFDPNSENKFISVKTGIDCERCHGPGSLHVKDKMAGIVVDTSKTPDYTIVNPRRLSTELQNNICQRCHLQGIATLRDGKTFFDFRPGMKLSEVVNVFMPEYNGAKDKMIMASHVERMKKSRCYVESGKMSCITCHNPHISVKYTARSTYNNACMNCHTGAGKMCTANEQARAAKNNDCVDCHMPHNSSIDIPHVAVTDHYIRKYLAQDTSDKKITAFLGMHCINNDHPDAITIARGFMEFYERYNPSKGLLDSAIYYLDKQPDIEKTQKQNRDYIRAYFLLGDFKKVTELSATLIIDSVKDAWTAYRIGESYYKQLHPENAVAWYERATKIWKYALDFQNKYGICLISVGNMAGAKEVFKFVVSQNPGHISANTNLGYIYMHDGDNELALKHMLHTYQLDPDYEQNLLNMAVMFHNTNRPNDTKKILEHLIKKHPENERAKEMLSDLLHK